MKVIVGEGPAPETRPLKATRHFDSFLSAYQIYTQKLEVTPKINVWIGLTVLAAALERKVWFCGEHGNIYPNLYTVIVGPSGITRKSTAMEKGVNILRGIPTVSMLSQRLTEAALIESFRHAYKKFTFDNREHPHSSVFGYSSELTSLIKETHGIVTDLLTDLFDCGGVDSTKPWTKETKGEGKTKIFGPCLSLLAGITPEHLHLTFPAEKMEMGFASRVTFIYEPSPPEVFYPLRPKTRAQWEFEEKLTDDLNWIHQRIWGEMLFSDEAQVHFDTWYLDMRQRATSDTTDVRFTGYVGRKAVFACKVAMLIAASRKDSLVIELADLQGAIELIEREEPFVFRLLNAAGRNPHASLINRIREQLSRKGAITETQLMRDHFQNANLEEIKAILGHMSAMGTVQSVFIGGKPSYALAESKANGKTEPFSSHTSEAPEGLNAEADLPQAEERLV